MKIYSLSDGMKDISVNQNSIKNNLAIGTVLYFNGYGDHKKVITQNMGINPRYVHSGAMYKYVDLEDYTEGQTEAYGINHISEKKDNRIALYYTDQVMTSEQVELVLKQAKAKASFLADEKVRKEQKSKELIEKYKQENPHLVPLNAPKNIRIELKKAFPGIKFSVRSDHSSININWNDGPTTKEVENITGKYQKGSFNGMEDIYEYDKAREWTDTFGGAQYVTESRHYSEKALKEAVEATKAPVTIQTHQDGSAYLQTSNYDDQRIVYAYLENKSFKVA